MEIVLTSREALDLDRDTTLLYGIPDLLLMENAAERIFQAIKNKYSPSQIHFLAGRGNNGGDALAIARKFFQNNISIRIYLFTDSQDNLSPLSILQTEILQKLNIPLFLIGNERDYQSQKEQILKAPFLIDGLLGIGLHSPLKGLLKTVVEDINADYQGEILAIDVPSGLSGNFDFFEPVLKASATFTVETPKINMLDYPGKSFCGEIISVPIGFPAPLLIKNRHVFKVEEKDLILPERKRDSHKGAYGKTLILSGSKNYPGAALLASGAALKSGTGLLYYYGEVCQEILIKYPEIILLDKIENLDLFDSILAGPGWGEGNETLLKKLISDFSHSLILDADALNLISRNPKLLKNRKNTLLTPHLKEFSRLTGKDTDWIKKNKLQALSDFAVNYPDVSVLLKDSVSILKDGSSFYYLEWGSDALARGGSGDLLAGLCSGFAAQLPLKESVFLSSFLNGKTADLLAELKKSPSVHPSVILENYQLAWNELEKIKCRKINQE
ncbi:MAG TPA: NAD(P)H-hydrate dehydratase [Spirochaetia bacterium]|nr:NAD(P)H-hydrate dehydratase [Spirochaetia bacterium]